VGGSSTIRARRSQVGRVLAGEARKPLGQEHVQRGNGPGNNDVVNIGEGKTDNSAAGAKERRHSCIEQMTFFGGTKKKKSQEGETL